MFPIPTLMLRFTRETNHGTQPWYDFLEEMNFDDGDEISIYYRYYEKIWDIIIRTQEDWEDSDNN